MNKKNINQSEHINLKPLERIKYIKNKNGVRVVAEETSEFLPFSFSFSILSGSRDEHKVPNGTAHFLEHLLFRRTKRLKSKQIAKEFEKLGAIANAFTTKEYTSYFVTANQKNFEKVVRLLYEVVFEPDFNKQDLDKERKIIIDEIKSSDDDPEDVITDKLAEIQFSNSTLANPIAGTQSSVNSIEINDIDKFFNNHYVTDNLIIAYAGPKLEKFLEFVDKLSFSQIQREKIIDVLNFLEPKQVESNSNITSQTHLSMNYLSKNCSMQFRLSLALYNIMLTEAMSSRLYQSIREKNGLTYNIYSSFSNYIDFTELNIFSSFDLKYKRKVASLIKAEFDKIVEKKFLNTELSIAKELLKTYSLIDSEGSLNKINNLTRQVMLYDKVENSQELIKSISDFKLEDINQFINEVFDFEKWYRYFLIPD